MQQGDLKKVIEALSKEKGLSKEVLIEALLEGIKTAAKKKFGNKVKIEVKYDEETGTIDIYKLKEVVSQVSNPETEVALEDLQKMGIEAKIGDLIGEKIELQELGRIAAQIVKQLFSQKVRLAEKQIVYEEFKHKLGDIVSGYVHRFDKRGVILAVGRAEALLPEEEQVPGEKYIRGNRLKALLIEVYRQQEPQLVVSRSHPAFVKKLFEKEVPEIQEGIVKIVSVAREPGSRTKIAVTSNNPNIDPVGACIGVRGSRISIVLEEINLASKADKREYREKIDVVLWDPDPAKFVYNALAPAECSKVIVDEKSKLLEVVVPDDQLSLAIGKKGENVKLASKLVGWKIDILSETQFLRRQEPEFLKLIKVTGLSDEVAGYLYEAGIKDLKTLLETPAEKIAELTKLSLDQVEQILEKAKKEQVG
ncbi:transcription termination/antitermination protein NusA [Thermodesulfobacterium sp. TA1]|uniref:transcription termination factor NusA n=1 Tax=Thermodesulfobacterium sp. TA1 TaxID=2234087 RepID=UPI001232CB36|nr:transcription termination factor NusA [Thermodesulfobacterium sp. TA1]QER42063.1 transcription termination/antitermination protein NusA [Thermodesulfobacterium sp. TA1]